MTTGTALLIISIVWPIVGVGLGYVHFKNQTLDRAFHAVTGAVVSGGQIAIATMRSGGSAADAEQAALAHFVQTVPDSAKAINANLPALAKAVAATATNTLAATAGATV